MEETLKKVTDQLLKLLELSQILNEKDNFVKLQKYDEASKMRNKELKIRKQLMTSDELYELRETFNKLK